MRAASGVADVAPRETRTNYRIEESHPNAAPQVRVFTQPRPATVIQPTDEAD